MNKILPLVSAISFKAAPVLAWGEGGCSFSKKNKQSRDEPIKQVESSGPSYK